MGAYNGSNQILYATLFCAILCVTWGGATKYAVQVPVEETLKLRQQAVICGEEFGVDPINLKKMIDGTLPNDDPHKGFMHCVLVATGYIEKGGKVSLDKMKQMKVTKGTVDDLVRVADECNKKISLEIPADSTYALSLCIVESFVVQVSA